MDKTKFSKITIVFFVNGYPLKIQKYSPIEHSCTKPNSPIAGYRKYSTLILTFIPILLHPSSLQAQPLAPIESKVKLSGEVLFGTAGYSGVTQTVDRSNSQVVFDKRVRLNIETKFTPTDQLKIRLETGNSTPLNSSVTGTNMTRVGYDSAKNNINLSLLQYQFPLSDRTQAIFDITGSSCSDNLDNFSPLANSSTGSMSRFGRYQPIYRLSNDGSGLTIKHQFSEQWSASASYTAPSLTTANPSNGGFSNGANAAIGQIKYSPSKDLKVGITYARSYHPTGSGVTGSTGSLTANNPFGEATTAQHYGLNASYQMGDVNISGWWGLTEAQSTIKSSVGSQSTNYAISIAANNLGGQGNTLGIIIGVPPKSNRDRDTSLHLETIYKVKVNDNIDITPGLLVITNPEHNRNNPAIWVGTIRTTFRF